MIINVNVHPSSSENKIEKINENEFDVYVKEKADDNKANIALIKLLARHFDVSHKNIRIKNPTSRNKVIEIKD